jgi:hypothetical protein
MAKPRKFLKTLLRMIQKRPMTSGEICKKTKKHRKVVRQNLKLAQNEGLVYQDGLQQYHITTLGKLVIDYIERPTDFTRWQIYSQVIDPISSRSNRPTATCTLITKNAEKIKELDNRTSPSPERFILELSENSTPIKAALANVVDSVLEIRAKDTGLKTVRDGQLAEDLSIFNVETNFPGFDYLKRYITLANINFKVLIEFDGEKWVKTQRFNDIRKQRNDSLNIYRKATKSILSENRRIRLNKAVQILSKDWLRIRNLLQYSNLFENEEDLKEYAYKIFGLHEQDKDRLKEAVQKAFESELLRYYKKALFYLEVDKEKLQEYHSLVS